MIPVNKMHWDNSFHYDKEEVKKWLSQDQK